MIESNQNQDPAQNPQENKEDAQPSQSPPQTVHVQGKKRTRLDKLVMGAIVGVAIGSVVGAALAPKKHAPVSARAVGLKPGPEKASSPSSKPNPSPKAGFFRKLFNILFGIKTSKNKGNNLPLKKIPNEDGKIES